jgi:hypothetical protein
MIVIGSTALLTNLGHLDRTPKDVDVFAEEAEVYALQQKHNLKIDPLSAGKLIARSVPGVGNIEFELFKNSESARGYAQYMQENMGKPYLLLGELHTVAPNEVLYSIKRSHRHYPRFFSKHIRDYHTLKHAIHSFPEELQHLTKIREKETEERYGKLKTPSLMKDKNAFFTDKVSNRVFIHDDIHAIMAHRERPMYEYIAKADGSVASDKNKFFALEFQDQCRCVLEEAYVIALERCIIPMFFESRKPVSTEAAFEWALMRICTTLTSGWFRDFATENWAAIHFSHNRDYAKKFFQAYQDGKISRISRIK